MSRRGVVLTIVILGVGIFAFLIVRSFEQETDRSVHTASETNSSRQLPRENGSETWRTAQGSETPLSESSSSSASSGQVAKGAPARGPRGDRRASGAASYDIRGAQIQADPLFSLGEWKVWKGVVAYPKTQGVPQGKTLGEVNGYYLVEEDRRRSSDEFEPSKPMVVFRLDTRTAGVVTGNFAVVLEEGASSDFLTQDPQIKIVSSFPEIQTYYVTSSQVPFSLKSLQDSLTDAPEVKEVKMEILDRQYEKF